MSDILIKGMEMPKNCDSCRIMMLEDTNCVPELFCGCLIVSIAHPQGEDHRPDYCPLIEIPTPHGRLIDADALMRSFHDEFDDEEVHAFECGAYWFHGSVINHVINSPTIIERE